MSRQYRDIVKSRYLAERSYLYFQYPGSERIEFYLPMIENPEIAESQSASHAEYNPIGRSGSLFAYLGSRSRDITVKFNITLPNIVDYIYNVGLSEMFNHSFRKLGTNLKDAEMKKFKRNSAQEPKVNYYDNAYNDLVAIDPRFRTAERSQFARLIDNIFGLNRDTSIQNNPTMREAVNYLILWVNVIRTATVNNSERTTLGPPMIFLNHGTMYNNIPCVCKSYSVRLNTPLGYDLISLTPRQIEITLNLSETRVGNFKSFTPFFWKESENLAGWEAVVGTNSTFGTMDPNTQITSTMFGQVKQDRQNLIDLSNGLL